VTCFQGDGGSIPVRLPINIWSMQCLITEEPVSGVPLRARITRDGPDMTVEVENTADLAVTDGYVRFSNNRVMKLGPVPAKSTRRFTRKPKKTKKPWDVKRWDDCVRDSARPIFTGDQAYFAWGTLGRTRSIEDYLERGAAVVCLRYVDSDAGFGLKKRQAAVNHIQMARLVVFPEEGTIP
ncbi:hypothetical protein LCGC14_2400410, partial [marine sediment metagenome]